MLYSIVNLGLGGVAVETFRNDRERERERKRSEREFIFNQVYFTRTLQSAPFFLFFFFLPRNIIKRAFNFCGHVNKIEMEIA